MEVPYNSSYNPKHYAKMYRELLVEIENYRENRDNYSREERKKLREYFKLKKQDLKESETCRILI